VQRLGQLSPDGRKYWDSQRWVSAISRDGNWQWNGRTWVAIPSADQSEPPANVLGASAAGIGFLDFRAFKGGMRSTLVVVAALLLLQLVVSVVAFELGVHSTGLQGQIAALPWAPNWWPVQPSPRVTHPSPSPVVAASRTARTPAAVLAQPTPSPVAPTCGAPPNPFGYDFCPPASLIFKPASRFCHYFDCIGGFWKSTNGYVVECADGKYSRDGGQPGACSSHGRVLRPLYS
jgi:hypothetical protein